MGRGQECATDTRTRHFRQRAKSMVALPSVRQQLARRNRQPRIRCRLSHLRAQSQPENSQYTKARQLPGRPLPRHRPRMAPHPKRRPHTRCRGAGEQQEGLVDVSHVRPRVGNGRRETDHTPSRLPESVSPTVTNPTRASFPRRPRQAITAHACGGRRLPLPQRRMNLDGQHKRSIGTAPVQCATRPSESRLISAGCPYRR